MGYNYINMSRIVSTVKLSTKFSLFQMYSESEDSTKRSE